MWILIGAIVQGGVSENMNLALQLDIEYKM